MTDKKPINKNNIQARRLFYGAPQGQPTSSHRIFAVNFTAKHIGRRGRGHPEMSGKYLGNKS